MVTTMPSSCFFSLPSSWAFFGSFQTAGSSSDALTVLRRSDFASKSKIPPEIGRPGLQVLQGGADQVGAFCVHFFRHPSKNRGFSHFGLPGAGSGNERMNSEPSPGVLRTSRRPWCAWAICRAM